MDDQYGAEVTIVEREGEKPYWFVITFPESEISGSDFYKRTLIASRIADDLKYRLDDPDPESLEDYISGVSFLCIARQVVSITFAVGEVPIEITVTGHHHDPDEDDLDSLQGGRADAEQASGDDAKQDGGAHGA